MNPIINESHHAKSKVIEKIVIVFIAVILLASIILFAASCSKHHSKTQTQVATESLTSKTWAISTVTADGVDKTSSFAGMTLSFTPTLYTTTNGNTVWPGSGAWTFTDSSAKTITRDDQIVVTIVQATSSSLILSLNWPTTTFKGGRTSSVSGSYQFQFK